MGCKTQGTIQNRTKHDITRHYNTVYHTTIQTSEKQYSLSPCEIHTNRTTLYNMQEQYITEQNRTNQDTTNQNQSDSEFHREMGCKAQGTVHNSTRHYKTEQDSTAQYTTEQHKTSFQKQYSLSPCEIHTNKEQHSKGQDTSAQNSTKQDIMEVKKCQKRESKSDPLTRSR